MKNFIYNEMMTHIPLCTHKDPKNVLIISTDAGGLIEEIQKHDDVSCDIISSGDAIKECEDNNYDVVISEEGVEDAALLAHINRVLKDDGLLVSTHPSLDNKDQNKIAMQILSNYTKIIMPYNLGNGSTAILASKSYHPTADIILHRADMLDNLDFYNCDIHIASFAMGNYIRKEYLGIIKN